MTNESTISTTNRIENLQSMITDHLAFRSMLTELDIYDREAEMQAIQDMRQEELDSHRSTMLKAS